MGLPRLVKQLLGARKEVAGRVETLDAKGQPVARESKFSDGTPDDDKTEKIVDEALVRTFGPGDGFY